MTMPAGAYAVGRRVPHLALQFFAPVTGLGQMTPIISLDFNTDIASLQATQSLNAGYDTLQVVYDALQRYPNEAEERLFARLEKRDEFRQFVHVRVVDGTDTIWSGRISKLYNPAGRFLRFDAKGYGSFAVKDYPLQWSDTTQGYTSGQLVQQAIATAAPMLTVGAQNATQPTVWIPGVQFVDPGIPHSKADIGNVKFLGELLQQVVSEGNSEGNPVWFGVFENRTFYLLPQTPLSTPEYLIDWSQAVDFQEDAEPTYGAGVFTYSGGSQPSITWPPGGNNPEWNAKWGFSTTRQTHEDFGSVSDARALALAQTRVTILEQPVATTKVTVGGPTNEGEVEGLRLSTGGTRAPQNIRVGEYVQIGAEEAGNTIVLPIVRLTLTATAGSFQNVLELGALDPNIDNLLHSFRINDRHFANQTSPISGAAL